jgi:hypothetical protein
LLSALSQTLHQLSRQLLDNQKIHTFADSIMECLTNGSSTSPVLISNAKVLEMLQKNVKENKKRLAKVQKAKDKKHNKKTMVRNRFEHRDWIEEKVLNYLKKTPCIHLPIRKIPELKRKCMGTKRGSMQRQDKPTRNAAAAMETATEDTAASPTYGLTEAETLQILNFMPEEPVEIHLMVEELHARMSETQQEEFLAMIQSYSTKGSSNKAHGKKRKRSGSDMGNHDAVVGDGNEQIGGEGMNDEGYDEGVDKDHKANDDDDDDDE